MRAETFLPEAFDTSVGRHTVWAATFGLMIALSLAPLMAFLIIGLGVWLEGRYWLSSLIVASVFTVGGGLVTYFSYRAWKRELKLERSRSAIRLSRE